MSALAPARGAVRQGLGRALPTLERLGVDMPEGRGQALRPLIAHAVAGALGHPCDDRFWRAALSVQLAHEASLVHDDVVDGAAERRGRATVHAARGVGAAVVVGDHLLTAGYRLAADTGSAQWMRLYAEAVERTVAGELQQAGLRGRPLTMAEYVRVVGGKSGELLGLAAAAGPMLCGDARAEACRDLGRSLGVLYQMLDDLLDFCPAAATGKPALRDHAQRQWTWVLAELGSDVLDISTAAVCERLHAPDGAGTPLRRILDAYAAHVDAFLAHHRALLPDDAVLPELLAEWLDHARRAVAREEVLRLAHALPDDDRVLARHSRSFRLAACFFPPAMRRRVAAVYAFCRFTDDLVDESDAPADVRHARLDAWRALAQSAYDGERTGIGFLDRSIGEMRAHDVPFSCADELIAGVRMDLDAVHYPTTAALRQYSWRVASVVGAWLTRLFGIHDPWTLDRAAALGHAMQLTNILRDVGEDLRRGRVYVPGAVLADFGLDDGALHAMARGALHPRWPELVEHLIRVAERDYAHALTALHRLPLSLRAPVAIAARVYAGIHEAIRANGYDTLTRRAVTPPRQKARLAARALRDVIGTHNRSAAPRTPAATTAAVAALLAVAPAAAQRPARPATVDPPGIEVVDRLARIDSLLTLAPEDAALQLERLRVLYVVAVDDERAVEAGLAQVALLQQTDIPAVALLHAYRGAFETLRAKHAFSPATRLRAVREGLRALDAAVAAAPDHAEVRYLRLVTGYHLPGFFRRGDEVAADFDHLARLLRSGAGDMPPGLRRAAADFVLAHAPSDPATRAALEATLGPEGR